MWWRWGDSHLYLSHQPLQEIILMVLCKILDHEKQYLLIYYRYLQTFHILYSEIMVCREGKQPFWSYPHLARRMLRCCWWRMILICVPRFQSWKVVGNNVWSLTINTKHQTHRDLVPDNIQQIDSQHNIAESTKITQLPTQHFLSNIINLGKIRNKLLKSFLFKSIKHGWFPWDF